MHEIDRHGQTQNRERDDSRYIWAKGEGERKMSSNSGNDGGGSSHVRLSEYSQTEKPMLD